MRILSAVWVSLSKDDRRTPGWIGLSVWRVLPMRLSHALSPVRKGTEWLDS
jgi:hypothetical protein